jgi:hypothetical protein
MQRLPIILSMVLLVAVAVLFQRMRRLEKAVGEDAAHHGPEEVEVAVYMGRMHTYSNKLWIAGSQGNLELALFYQHEIEEVMEEVEHAGIMDGDVDISAAMRTIGIPVVEGLKAHLKAEGLSAFNERYELLLGACNSCHSSTGHGIIRIASPAVAAMGQDFAPVAP